MDTDVINTAVSHAAQIGFRVAIYSLLLLTFCLGLPSFHYATALIITLLIRHRHDPAALLRPVGSPALASDR